MQFNVFVRSKTINFTLMIPIIRRDYILTSFYRVEDDEDATNLLNDWYRKETEYDTTGTASLELHNVLEHEMAVLQRLGIFTPPAH